jgi:hypothetical protein
MASGGNEFFYVHLIALHKIIFFFYKYYIHMASLLCEYSYAPSDAGVGKISSNKYHIYMA